MSRPKTEGARGRGGEGATSDRTDRTDRTDPSDRTRLGKRATLALLIAIVAIIAVVGLPFALSRSRALAPSAGAGSRGGEVAMGALPDAPSSEESALIEAATAAAANDPKPAAALGRHYLDAGRAFEALWAYAHAIQAAPGDPTTNSGLARALDAALLRDAAIKRLWAHSAISRHLTRPIRDARAVSAGLGRPSAPPGATPISELQVQLAELLLRTGRPEEALAALRAAGPAFLATRDGATLEGRVRQALGDGTGARAAYWRAVEQDAKDPEARYRMGTLELAQGKRFEAQQAFGAATILATANPRYDVALGRAFAASAKPEEQRRAPEYFAAAMRHQLRYAPAHYEAGLWYLQRSRRKEAIERLQMAVSCDPGHADAHEQLARALAATGRNAEAFQSRGLAYAARGLRAPALREYQKWAAAAPSDADALLQVANSFFEMNQSHRAMALLSAALPRFPGNIALRERLIALLLLNSERPKARALCEQWLKEAPGEPRVLWLLGRAASDDQQYDEAIRLYEQGLAKEPENAEWNGALGEALLQRPDDASARRAVAALTHAASGEPEQAKWRFALAQGLQRLGRHADARRQALRALDLDPHQGKAYALVVQLARQERATAPLSLYADLVRGVEERLRKEMALYLATWQRPNDADAYIALAAFLVGIGDLDEAEGQLAEALRLRPGSGDARDRLARVRRLREVQ